MTDNSERISLGERIKEARTYRGFSQEEVAKFLGVSRSSISLIESGERGIDALELQRIAALFRCDVKDLIGEKSGAKPLPTNVVAVARATAQLSAQDRDEVLRFAKFLQTRQRKSSNER